MAYTMSIGRNRTAMLNRQLLKAVSVTTKTFRRSQTKHRKI